jgi:hypothetical protein
VHPGRRSINRIVQSQLYKYAMKRTRALREICQGAALWTAQLTGVRNGSEAETTFA